MSVLTLQGTVENGQIRLSENVQLPEKAVVYVVVPSLENKTAFRVMSPRLAHPEEAADFKMEVVKEAPHARL